MWESDRQFGLHRVRIAAVCYVVAAVVAGCGNSIADAGSPSADTGVPDTGQTDAMERPDASQPGGPPYPIVLAHGFAGFDHLIDGETEALAYYFRVESALETVGETVVIGEVDPFNDSTERGEQLISQIEMFLANSPHDRVNIIGHSQGGLDARYVAHHRPEMVASVVTIATPHRGTRIADIVLELVDHELTRAIADDLVRLFGKPLYDEAGEQTSMFDALKQFSEKGIETFNAEITNAPSVYYASIAGRTDGHLGKSVCETRQSPPFISRWSEQTDKVDPFLDLTEDILDGTDDDPRANDGMVRVTSAKWGEFLGCIPADHLDEVGHLIGDDPGPDNDWDHLDFFINLAEYLHRRGM